MKIAIAAILGAVVLAVTGCGHVRQSSSAAPIPKGACEGLSQTECRGPYVLAGLNPKNCHLPSGVGCIDGPVSPPSTTSPPAPAPASTDATLASDCVMGYLPGGQGAVFTRGARKGQTIQGTYYPPVPAYQLMLTDSSPAAADVGGFAVVFYDSSATELGSDQETVTSSFITTGQSLVWTELSSTDTAGNGTSGSASVPDGSVTCQVVQWYHP